jgi:cell wall-associated NlpC family hydrolase
VVAPLASARRPWRALSRAVGITGLTFALGLLGAATPAPALAAPAAAPAASTAATAARPRVASAKKARKGAKAATSSRNTKAGKATRSAKIRKAAGRAHSTKAARAERRTERRAERRAERPAPRASADLLSVDAVTVPQVVLPELTLASTGTGNPFTLVTRSATSLLDGLLTRARGQLGTRYVYGATDPDNALDCSSFARYVMEALGVRLPRTANQQAQVGAAVPRDLTALRPGDLLTFGSRRRTSHVGIYLGQGRFIHASVSSGRVIETTIERNRALFRRWQGARRLVAGVDTGSATGAESGG